MRSKAYVIGILFTVFKLQIDQVESAADEPESPDKEFNQRAKKFENP